MRASRVSKIEYFRVLIEGLLSAPRIAPSRFDGRWQVASKRSTQQTECLHAP